VGAAAIIPSASPCTIGRPVRAMVSTMYSSPASPSGVTPAGICGVQRVPRRLEFDDLDEETHVAADEEMTEIRRRPLFRIRIRRDDESQPVVRQIFKSEVRIGRGGRNVPVDVALAGDREISRLHAILRQTASGYEISMEGKNPMFVAGHEIRPGDAEAVQPGEPIQIGMYTLCVLPDDTHEERDVKREADESN